MATMIDPALPSVGAVAAALAGGFSVLQTRELIHRARETDLRESVELLRAHCEALSLLDSDDVPVALLEFVYDLSETLHDPSVRREVVDTVAFRKETRTEREPTTPLADDDPIVVGYIALSKARPELAFQFVRCIFTGVLSFEKRWPECAGAFSSLPQIMNSPVGEARRVVEVARRNAGSFVPTAAAAA